MKTLKTIISITLIGSIAIFSSSCKRREGCTDPNAINYDSKAKHDDGSCEYANNSNSGNNTSTTANLTFKINHLYNGQAIMFDTILYTNLAGNNHSITRLRYIISDIRLYKSNGDSVMIDGYHFVDFKDNPASDTYSPSVAIPKDTYTGLAFVFGLDSLKNISNAYPDLNAANWNWPEMLGGGYHFLQFEGNFIDTTGGTTGFAYHMGTARKITPTDTIFEQNWFLARLQNSSVTVNGDATIYIDMNLEQWFENPHTWNLDTLYNTMMPNYNAQKLMNDNGRTVFTFGSIQ
jgi:hypothetical protein